MVRVFDGVEVRGRFINDWAYASYARGVEWEARGQHEDALRFYDEALEQDPDSVEIWTRVGATRCRLKRSDADDAFAEAESLASRYEPLWRERALCAEQRGDAAGALAAARKAVRADPAREETVLLLARLLVAGGELEEAERWLRSLAVRSPRSSAVWSAVARFAKGRAPALHAVATDRLAKLQPGLDAPRPRKRAVSATPWQKVDDALVAGSLADARTQARKAHLDLRKLGARAILVGRPKLAFEEAELRLGADPTDGDARITLALSADLTGQAVRAGEILAAMPAAVAPLSPMGEALLAELLLRHESVEVAAMWLGVDAGALAGDGAPRARLARSFGGAAE